MNKANTFRALALVPFAALGCRACAPAHHAHRTPVVVINENNHAVIDVRPPQRLDVRMTNGGTIDEIRARCDDMGGTDLTAYEHWTVLVCEGVDY